MGIESEEDLLKSDGVVPKRSSGSVVGYPESKDLWCAERKEAMRGAGKGV